LVNRYKEQGVAHVKEASEVPTPEPNERVIALIGPHGFNGVEIDLLQTRGVEVRDTVCPLVLKPYSEIKRNSNDQVQTLYWGQEGHAETLGAMSVASDWTILIKDLEHALSEEVAGQIKDPERLGYASQTTHNWDEAMKMMDVLREKYPNLRTPKKEDICFATKNRQDAVRSLLDAGATAIVVVGSPTSSNSTRLAEIASEGAKAYFVDSVEELNPDLFYGHEAVGITSGASVEEDTMFDVMKIFIDKGSKLVPVTVADESNIHFKPSQPGKNYYNEL